MWDLKNGKTNDNMGLAEYVADADKCDQQPSGGRDEATSPYSKVGEQILQSSARCRLNW